MLLTIIDGEAVAYGGYPITGLLFKFPQITNEWEQGQVDSNFFNILIPILHTDLSLLPDTAVIKKVVSGIKEKMIREGTWEEPIDYQSFGTDNLYGTTYRKVYSAEEAYEILQSIKEEIRNRELLSVLSEIPIVTGEGFTDLSELAGESVDSFFDYLIHHFFDEKATIRLLLDTDTDGNLVGGRIAYVDENGYTINLLQYNGPKGYGNVNGNSELRINIWDGDKIQLIKLGEEIDFSTAVISSDWLMVTIHFRKTIVRFPWKNRRVRVKGLR